MLEEFKKFAMRGNVVDMAVGIIIGASFGKIVDSLVKDLIMPPIGLLLGKVDFANLFVVLKEGAVAGPYLSVEAAQKAGAVTFNYGLFINTTISFRKNRNDNTPPETVPRITAKNDSDSRMPLPFDN